MKSHADRSASKRKGQGHEYPSIWTPESLGAVVVFIISSVMTSRPDGGANALEAAVHSATPEAAEGHVVRWARPTWPQESQWPMLVAATIFLIQLLCSFIGLLLMDRIPQLADNWMPRFRRSLKAHIVIATMGSVFYIRDYWEETFLISYRTGYTQHLLMRNVKWTVGTPLQWYIYCMVCTHATNWELAPINVTCVGFQVAGILMHFMPNTGLMIAMFMASCVLYLYMFRLIFKLPLVKEMEQSAHFIRQLMFAVWSIYPCLNLLRWCDIVGDWTEQVLVFSILDACIKMFTLTSIVIARVNLTLSSMNGALQIILACHDLVLIVNENFEMLDCPQPVPLITHYFGSMAPYASLSSFCASPLDFERLKEGAAIADRASLGVPSPLCTIMFKSGKEFQAECYISKCINNRRCISMNVNLDAQSIAPSNVPSQFIMQLEIAIHHCGEFMALHRKQHEVLKEVLLNPHAATALCVWVKSEESESVSFVIASPRASSLYLQNMATPLPLAQVLMEDDIDTIKYSLSVCKPIAVQQAGTQLLVGSEVAVTVFPLAAAGEQDTLFFVLAFEDANESNGSSASHADTPRYRSAFEQGSRFWYKIGDQLVCAQSHESLIVGPPMPLRLPNDRGEELWSAFFMNDRAVSGSVASEESRDTLVTAVPMPALQVEGIPRFDDVLPEHTLEDARKRLESKLFTEDQEVPLPQMLQPLLGVFNNQRSARPSSTAAVAGKIRA